MKELWISHNTGDNSCLLLWKSKPYKDMDGWFSAGAGEFVGSVSIPTLKLLRPDIKPPAKGKCKRIEVEP